MRNLGVAAGLASMVCAWSADAQTVLPWGGDVRADPVGSHGGYESRSVQTVYAQGGNPPQTLIASVPQVLEDISFGPGYWETGAGRVISQITYGVGVTGTSVGTEQILLVFWNRGDVNFDGFAGAGSGMINPGAAPLAVARVGLGGLPPGFAYQVTTSLTGMPGGGVRVPDGDPAIALQVAWIDGGCEPAQYQDLSACLYGGCASTGRSLVLGGVGSGPGSTTPDFGRDIADSANCLNIGRFIGGGDEHAVMAGSALAVTLRGDIAPVTCTPDFNGDGDAGTDADIEAFFACIAGSCCAMCGSGDFNADGDTGTDADIEAFFRVLAGGSC